jgi:hypothetical protein
VNVNLFGSLLTTISSSLSTNNDDNLSFVFVDYFVPNIVTKIVDILLYHFGWIIPFIPVFVLFIYTCN